MKPYKIILLFILVMGIGCSEEWLEEKPPHLITSTTLYSSLAGFETGLYGLYGLARQEREGSEGKTLPFTSNPNALRADLIMNGTDNMCTNVPDRFSLVTAHWGERNSPSNAQITSNFIWLYTTINAANTIINQAESNNNVDWSGGSDSPENNKNLLIAEAKAIRAWAYRHLVYGWGDVPISLEESVGSVIRTDWERQPVAEVRKQMLTDWLFAEKNIPVEALEPMRLTKGAVQHYIAETYLAINKPDSALFWADKVVNNPSYNIVNARYGEKANQPGVAFTDMFQDGNSNRGQGNSEALWVWHFAYGISGGGSNIMRRWHMSQYDLITLEGGVRPLKLTYERGGRGVSRIALTKWAIDLYEPQDERVSNHAIRKYFILKNATENAPFPADELPPGYSYGDTVKLNWSQPITIAASRVDWPFSRKFDGTDPGNAGAAYSYNDQVYLRLAETYLIKAEAHLLLNQKDQAANIINVLRRRAKASEITANDITLDFILDERSRELVYEEHRRYTLLRTNKWLERTRLHNMNGGQNISDRDVLYPIPQSVIDANLTNPMPQNPGWN